MPALLRAARRPGPFHPLTISAGTVDGDRIDRAAGAVSRHRENGSDIGIERVLQGLQRHHGIVRRLMRGERLAIDQVRLHVRTNKLDGARHQRLDRIGHVVRLVEHVGGIETRHAAPVPHRRAR